MRVVAGILCLWVFAVGVVFADDNDISWRDVKKACHQDKHSDQCLQARERTRNFCEQHPNKKRCRKLHAIKQCKQDPDSQQCLAHKKRIKAYCENHPSTKKCVRARLHTLCKDAPESEECINGKQEAHENFCKNHPDKPRCK
ncbi:MAG: hypothetical protein AB8B89_07165 [Gammaproteobacteria bacterium]